MPSILRVVGNSNSGKTTFIQAILRHFSNKNIVVIKHSEKIKHLSFEKDSSKLFESGAGGVISFSSSYAEIFIRYPQNTVNVNFVIQVMLHLFSKVSKQVDLIIVEGCKSELDVPTIIVGERPEDLVVSNKNIILEIPRFYNLIDEVIERKIISLFEEKSPVNSNFILAIDPGKEKVGWAILNYQKEVLKKGVCFLSESYRVVKNLLQEFSIKTIVIGDSKFGNSIESLLRDQGINLPIVKVTEKNSTFEARRRYFMDHPPTGIWHLIPISLQVPPIPVDDYSAVIIGERYIDSMIRNCDE